MRRMASDANSGSERFAPSDTVAISFARRIPTNLSALLECTDADPSSALLAIKGVYINR